MNNLTITLIMFLSTLGPSMVIALVGIQALKSLARNPAAAPKILTSMITAFIFAEAIAILALLVVYSLFK